LAHRNPKIIISVRSVTSKQGRYFLPTRRLERWLMRSLYPRADQTIAVSNSAAQDCANDLGIDIDSIKVIYNPVLTPQFFQKLEGKTHHPWFLPGQPPVVLGVGRLSQVKDYGTLVRAFKHVQEWVPSRLLILGEGPQRAEIEWLVSQLGLSHSIQLAGFVPNPYPYFKNAAVFVSSSVYDASPNVLVEAMACGCPVVSTDCPGGAAELIGNGKYGHLAPVGDDQALAHAIMEVFNGDRRPASAEWLSNFKSQTALNHYRQLVEGMS
jgi:glycosyltransferase involved in cell wall biosynthesis